MKTLTLTPPWSQLIILGKKKIETRSWSTNYRGEIAIHASKAFPGSARDLCYTEPFREALGFPEGTGLLYREPEPPWGPIARQMLKAIPTGCVIGTARLVGCERIDRNFRINGLLITREQDTFTMTDMEREFGNYEPGRFAWILEDSKPLPKPIPAKGALGLWNWQP